MTRYRLTIRVFSLPIRCPYCSRYVCMRQVCGAPIGLRQALDYPTGLRVGEVAALGQGRGGDRGTRGQGERETRRRGEKLSEELFAQGEEPGPTQHEKILVAQGNNTWDSEAISRLTNDQ